MPFCRAMRPTKKHVRRARIDAEFLQRAGGFHAPVFVEVDAVVDDVDALLGHVEEPQDVGLRARADGDHGVGHFDRGLFHPAGKVVAAADLLALPRAQRLERMHREHHRDAVVHLRHDAAEMRVPSVQMHHVGVDGFGVPIQAMLHGTEDGMERLRSRVAARVDAESRGL